ncbi:Homeobox domain-containing protein, partial [Meloidogyne graminicola]
QRLLSFNEQFNSSSSSSPSFLKLNKYQKQQNNLNNNNNNLLFTQLLNQKQINSTKSVRTQRTPIKEIITLDDPNELDKFMSRGEEQCIQDMRTFITQFSLRQTTVALMTGVSQPYISKLLNGNHRELSLRCRKNIYCWYLNCRKHPEKLALFVQDHPTSRLDTTAEGELIPQRRERYVFRPVLIRILENYFKESPFPDTSKRLEIATACNTNLQLDKKGTQLMPKEVVTPQVVANWFANKRKEMRRRTQREK